MNPLSRIIKYFGELRNADGGDTGSPLDDLPDVGFVPLADLTHARNVAIYSLNNPLEWLTPRNAYYMLMRLWYGEYTRVQWVMDWAEKYDTDIMAITNRLVAAVRTMDIGVQVKSQTDPALKTLALAQKAELDKVLESIRKDPDNDQSVTLKEAIIHLVLAKGREFSHVGHYEKNGKIHLQNMRQLNVIRHGDCGKWLWNSANMITDFNAQSLQPMDPAEFIIRYHPRSALRISVIKFIRSNCSQEWWDAFCERVSKNAWILTAPESVGTDPKQIAAFNSAAQGIRRAGTGTVPFGTLFNSLDAKRGGSVPFHEHMAWIQDQCWLAWTGQQMSGLAKPAAMNSNSAEHGGDIISELAAGEAEEVSELVHEALFESRLNEKWPNDPHLAYFTIKSQSEKSSGAILDDAVKIKQAGGVVNWADISERTGYPGLTAAPDPVVPGGSPDKPPKDAPDDEDDPDADVENRLRELENRARPESLANRAAEANGIPASWLAPLKSVFMEIVNRAPDPLTAEYVDSILPEFKKRVPEIFANMDHDALAAWLNRGMQDAALEQVRKAAKRRAELNNRDTEGEARDENGRWSSMSNDELASEMKKVPQGERGSHPAWNEFNTVRRSDMIRKEKDAKIKSGEYFVNNPVVNKWKSGTPISGNDAANVLRLKGVELPENLSRAIQHDDTKVSKTGIDGRGMGRREAGQIHKWISEKMNAHFQ